MSEYQSHKLITELIEAIRSDVSPESILEYLENNKKCYKTKSDESLGNSLKKLIRNTEDPKALQQKFEELKLNNSDNFQSFVDFLALLAADPKLKQFLKASITKSDSLKDNKPTAFNLPEVCDQIKKIGSKKKLNISENDADRVKQKNTRSHQSWDFSFRDVQLRNTVLSDIPSISLENIIISDLLYVLVGLEGEYIVPEYVIDSTAKRNFILNPSLPTYIVDLLKQILPLASNYSIVQRFIEDKSKNLIISVDPTVTSNVSNTSIKSDNYEARKYSSALKTSKTCQVLQALCAALDGLMQDYFAVISQIEGEHKLGRMNLVKIIYYIKPVLHTLEIVADLVGEISKANDVSGKILSLLHERAFSLTGNQQAQKLCVYLTQEACKPYMSILNTWIHQGTIHDPHQEFMVEDNERICKRDVPLALDYADYWEKRYLLKRNRMPKFLQKVDDIILRTGKYLNVIQQCGKTITPAVSTPLVYSLSEAPLEKTITQAYAYASKTLLEMLMNEYDLPGRMRSVKHYFLLDQGDFIVQFMDSTEKELSKNVDDILPMRLESLLELTLRVSGANVDPYKDDIRTELLPFGLETQMAKILNISTETAPPEGKLHLSGVEAFTFGYDVKWPISLIFNRNRIFCYQIIFRHLFYCKHVERQLCRVWICNKEAKKFSAKIAEQYRPAFALRQRMLNCIQNLEYYMMVEVIEPGWNVLMQKIAKVVNVDDLLVCHENFVDATLKNCMITDTALLGIISRLCAVCIEFCDFMQEMRQYYVDAELTSMLTTSVCSMSDSITDNSMCSSTGYFSTLNKSSAKPGENIMEKPMTFSESIAVMDNKFTVILMSIFDKINDNNATTSGADKLINIVNRFHANSYYNKQRDKMFADILDKSTEPSTSNGPYVPNPKVTV